MKKEIKYIGFYDLPNSKIKRVSNIAAVNKMDYICNSIIDAGFSVHLISPSWIISKSKDTKFQKSYTIQLDKTKKITFCPSYFTQQKWTRNIKIIYTLFWLFYWLFKNTHRGDKILVYHVQWLSLPLRLAKKIKGFILILEVEELYEKVWENKKFLNSWEKKLVKAADYYIAVSDILAEILGEKTKAIVYGNYNVPKMNNNKLYFENDKINVVYAGSIDEIKGGAMNAVKCAELLPDSYLVHITGHGSEESEMNLRKEIEKINKNRGRICCIYHGVIDDDLFPSFLLSCQIALNPQYTGEKFSYLFPSKIIKYLSHNLRVVSTSIKSIELSKVSPLIIFSIDDQPTNIVKAVLSIDFKTPYNSVAKIQKLNDIFVVNIKKLLTDD